LTSNTQDPTASAPVIGADLAAPAMGLAIAKTGATACRQFVSTPSEVRADRASGDSGASRAFMAVPGATCRHAITVGRTRAWQAGLRPSHTMATTHGRISVFSSGRTAALRPGGVRATDDRAFVARDGAAMRRRYDALSAPRGAPARADRCASTVAIHGDDGAA